MEDCRWHEWDLPDYGDNKIRCLKCPRVLRYEEMTSSMRTGILTDMERRRGATWADAFRAAEEKARTISSGYEPVYKVFKTSPMKTVTPVGRNEPMVIRKEDLNAKDVVTRPLYYNPVTRTLRSGDLPVKSDPPVKSYQTEREKMEDTLRAQIEDELREEAADHLNDRLGSDQ